MIICKKCGTGIRYNGLPCPKCNETISFDDIDINNIREVLEDAQKNKQYDEVVECYHILADTGDTEAQRKYAQIFEKGSIAPRNFEIASEYYGKAARKNDPYSAYKYSRLIMRDNDATGRFWLLYAAVLGAQDAYAETAEEFSSMGNECDANYFYSLAAACDDIGAIVTMAKRYCDGIGTDQSPEYAKWYMDKLKIPPIYAIKLAYKLRGVHAKEPPMPTLKNYDGLLRKLCEQAEISGFDTAHFRLSKILAERGDIYYAVTVGDALARGKGCSQNLAEGIKQLSFAAAHGSIDAHIALGNLYYDGKTIEVNTGIALEHYIKAGALGSAAGYKTAADIFLSLGDEGKYIAEAVKYYDLASALGSAEATRAADIIKLEREKCYRTALEAEKTNPEQALNLYAMGCAMGHPNATLKLGDCFKYEIGTREDRRIAFKWYLKAAELGCDAAYTSLGECYADGYGTSRDYSKAKAALERARKLGDERAYEKIISLMNRKKNIIIRRLYSKAMHLIYNKKFDESKIYLEIAAELKHPKALYTLGCSYEFGLGTPCDKNKAYSYYEEAYELGFRDPKSEYKLAILKLIKSQKER